MTDTYDLDQEAIHRLIKALVDLLQAIGNGPEPTSDETLESLLELASASAVRARGGRLPARDGCPHCDPNHESPHRCSWGVRVAPDVDGDGQPTHLIVQPSNGAHVAQADADWLFLLIRDRVCVHEEPLPEPEPEPPAQATGRRLSHRGLGRGA